MAYYKNLIVWQKSFYVAEKVYILTRAFPSSQRYSLSDQIERSAVSIMSNIAEGSRRTPKEWKYFLRIAYGSVSELESQLILARKLHFGAQELYLDIFNHLNEISRILNTLIFKSSSKPIH
jgi:four helix bundle protein